MKKQSTIPTLQDVAQKAGVSTATVSRVLNSPAQVNSDTRKRVEQAVQELKYSPNFGARALAAKRTNTIGAVIPTMDNAIFSSGIHAFQQELHRHKMTLLVASSAYSLQNEEEQIKTMIARGADGILLVGYHRSPAIYDMLEYHAIPTLIAWAYDAQAPHISVGFDNTSAMGKLTAQVLSKGHKNIGIISAPLAENDRAHNRVQGIYNTVENAANDISTTLIETQYGIQNGAEAFEQLMQGQTPPSAVMCGNDVLAVGAIGRAREMGLDVPHDVSITGFDDIELSTVCTPALTTVHVPHRAMGQNASRILVDMVRGAPCSKGMRLDVTLKLRGSLGPAKP